MGDGTKENPYTREDVLRLIEEHGGTADGLDLSGKHFEERIDLRKLDLEGIILKKAILLGAHLEGAFLRDAHLEEAHLVLAHLEEADLWDAHLEGAVLVDAHLEEATLKGAHLEEAILVLAHLEKANLEITHLEKASLMGAHLEGADLGTAQFDDKTNLEDVYWGNFILGEERDGYLALAANSYQRLKQWYTNAGMYDIAGEFFFREMTAKRKAMKWWPNLLNRAFSKLLSILGGYGEKPERVVISALVIIFALALVYFTVGTLEPNAFLDCLYYSFVSFTAVGYGAWVTQSAGWVKWLGVLETILGVFMMALFLVTFTRKMTR